MEKNSPIRQIPVASQSRFIAHICVSMPVKQNHAQGNPLKEKETTGWAKLLMYGRAQESIFRREGSLPPWQPCWRAVWAGITSPLPGFLSPEGCAHLETLQEPAVVSGLVLHQEGLNLNI